MNRALQVNFLLCCPSACYFPSSHAQALISNYYVVVFLFVLFGIASNLVDVFINTLMVGMLGEDGAPLMQVGVSPSSIGFMYL